MFHILINIQQPRAPSDTPRAPTQRIEHEFDMFEVKPSSNPSQHPRSSGRNRTRLDGLASEKIRIITLENMTPSQPHEKRPDSAVTTPEIVRAGASVLLGLGVAAMAMPLPILRQVILLVVAVGAAFIFTFSHPYRKWVRRSVELRGGRYKTSFTQILPLFPLWLLLMILPAFQFNSWLVALIVLAISAGYAWFVFPGLDGTRNLDAMEPGV